MRKIIRAMIDDLRKPDIRETAGGTNFIPQIPPAPVDAPTVKYDAPVSGEVTEDLSNQILSSDPAEEVRQLDWQAQKDEERETLE